MVAVGSGGPNWVSVLFRTEWAVAPTIYIALSGVSNVTQGGDGSPTTVVVGVRPLPFEFNHSTNQSLRLMCLYNLHHLAYISLQLLYSKLHLHQY